jgi:hypothetical protein
VRRKQVRNLPSALFREKTVHMTVWTLRENLVARRRECHQVRSYLQEQAPPAVNLQTMSGAPSPRSTRKYSLDQTSAAYNTDPW